MLFLVGIVLTACSEKDEVSHSATCLDRLDNKKYSAIADDSSCSTYERASAELGLGGVSVKKILDQTSSRNFVEMFNISATTFETNIQHLQSAVTMTENLIGSNRELTEIHLVASAVVLINETWGRVDANFDGDIEESEFMNFLKIDETAVQSSGQSTFDISDLFQLVDTDGNAWIWVKDDLTWRSDTDFDGIADGSHVALPGSVSLTQVAFIAGITDLQSLFTTNSTTDVQAGFDFLSTATLNARLVDRDLDYLGISADNSVREIINDSVDQLDNGATCHRSVISIIDGFSSIIANAATVDTAAEYQTHNLLTLPEAQAISSDVVFYIPTVPANIDVSGAEYVVRIIYQKTGSPGGFVGLYQDADSDISDPLNILKFLTLDASSQPITSVSGDGIITLKEVLCF